MEQPKFYLLIADFNASTYENYKAEIAKQIEPIASDCLMVPPHLFFFKPAAYWVMHSLAILLNRREIPSVLIPISTPVPVLVSPKTAKEMKEFGLEVYNAPTN